jgi:hypothetical protein
MPFLERPFHPPLDGADTMVLQHTSRHNSRHHRRDAESRTRSRLPLVMADGQSLSSRSKPPNRNSTTKWRHGLHAAISHDVSELQHSLLLGWTDVVRVLACGAELEMG